MPAPGRELRTTQKAAAAVAFILALTQAAAAQVHLGLRLGRRTVFDEKVREVYGDGFIYLPYLRLTSTRTVLGVEFAYEGGYNRSAPIGIYNEPSTLRFSGLEAAAFLHRRLGPVVPFVKVGIGYYFYKQEIDSPDIRQPVDRSEQQMLVGGGMDILLPRGFFLTGEFKYVPFKVAPQQILVDLSGFRYLVGIGFSFDPRPKKNIREVE